LLKEQLEIGKVRDTYFGVMVDVLEIQLIITKNDSGAGKVN